LTPPIRIFIFQRATSPFCGEHLQAQSNQYRVEIWWWVLESLITLHCQMLYFRYNRRNTHRDEVV